MSESAVPKEARFDVPKNHRYEDAQLWLTELLDSLSWNCEKLPWWHDGQVRNAVLERLAQQDSSSQITLLKACLERMVWHRIQPACNDGVSIHYYVGSIVYGIVCAIYANNLRYSENDICDILMLSHHACGHGGDVAPPFEIALAFARENGMSLELIDALRIFLAGLKGIRSAKVHHLKRKAALLSVLDSGLDTTAKLCWSDCFRTGLQRLPMNEQTKWQRLVLHMTANDVQYVPKAWHKKAMSFIEEFGSALVLKRLSSWWPDPEEKVTYSIQTGGSHLLKHFIWLLAHV